MGKHVGFRQGSQGGEVLMATVIQHPAATAPMPAVARILAQFDRPKLASFIEVAISLLDVADGDLDLELNGDEMDGDASEDDFMLHRHDGPGCPISDPDYAVDDRGCDGDEGY